MNVIGKIENGVVILPPGTVWPEGAQVKVETIPSEDPFVTAIENLAKARAHLPADYALNHGHYVGGEPRR